MTAKSDPPGERLSGEKRGVDRVRWSSGVKRVRCSRGLKRVR